jgi:hypothetical protein
MAISALKEKAQYAIYMPTDTVANSSSVDGSWLCPGGEAEVDFTSGIRIFMNANRIPNPAAAWSEEAESAGSGASAGVVNNQPALLIPPSTDSSQPARGSVTLVENGTWIVVEGNSSDTTTMSTLTDTASSMQPMVSSASD